MLTVFLMGSTTLASLFYIFNPHAPCIFGNLIPGHMRILTAIFSTLPHVFTSLVCHCNLWLLLVIAMYLSAVFIRFVLLEIKFGKSSCAYVSSGRLRKSWDLIIVYRTVQILMTKLNMWVGKQLIVIHWVATLFFVFSSCIVIKYKKVMSTTQLSLVTVWATLAVTFWSAILFMGGYLNLQSSKAISSWKRHKWNPGREHGIMKRFAISCRPISFGHGKFYQMKHVSVLIFLRSLSRGLVRVLLASRNDS